MENQLQFGIQTNGIKHRHADPMPDIDTRFRMVKEAGVFDYVDKTPAPNEVKEFLAARDKYDLPVRAGGWYYTLGRDEPLFEQNLAVARELGSVVHNTQIMTNHAEGRPVTDDEVVTTYQRFFELGNRYGVAPSFEVHVNMWSEDFRRVSKVGRRVEAKGLPFHITLDHSHVIFKIDHPEEQDVGGIREDVETGALELDPFKPRNICDEWIDAGWVRHCHARSTIPHNPRNMDAVDDQGRPGRGIQYPFKKPKRGQYHAKWDESALEPWKEVIRRLMQYHAQDRYAVLGQISTEFIPNFDYGEGCKYSLFEQGVACTEWMREVWKDTCAKADTQTAAE